MGLEFIEKAAPGFRKSWDRAKTALATADLFTQAPGCAARTAAADILGNASLEAGQRLTVEARDGGLIARYGNSDVAKLSDPASELVEAVEASYGVAKGTVEQVYPIARIVDISLC
mgnify:CR=1 FL=1